MKKVSIIGVGKLGLCLALNLELKGYEVIASDNRQSYVDSLNAKSFESDEAAVSGMLKRSLNFKATTNTRDLLKNDIIFVMVATPSLPDGRYDHQQVDSVVSELMLFGPRPNMTNLIICCTTMPGYCDTIQERLKDYNYNVIYNPEFIAIGTIIKDQRNPDMVLMGGETGNVSEFGAKELISVYKDLVDNDPRYCWMTRTEAELTKIALNCFLTTKIAYTNMVGDVAKAAGANPDVILDAIGSDSRIGKKYLKYGFGFGGPCFPRDNRAFGLFAESKGIYPHISYATDASNNAHLWNQFRSYTAANPPLQPVEHVKFLELEEKISHVKQEKNRIVRAQKYEEAASLRTIEKQLCIERDALQCNTKTTTITIDSVTYKPESVMIEESQQLKLALMLANSGYIVNIIERKAVIDQLKTLYGSKFIYTERN